MTREKALQVDQLLVTIEAYEALIEEISNLDTLREIAREYTDGNLEEELLAVVQARLNQLLKELEEM